MIWLLAFAAGAAEPEQNDCGRYRDGPELQSCEFRRDAQADILDAAGRPPARSLGREAIRFSTRPQLGGWATVVEIVPGRGGRVEGRLFLLYGHWRTSWRPQDTRRFTLSVSDYRRLAHEVDAALARWHPSVVVDLGDGRSETVVCTDGPGYLTERVREGEVVTLVGQCSPSDGEDHANRVIARLIRTEICRHLPSNFDPRFQVDGDCSER